MKALSAVAVAALLALSAVGLTTAAESTDVPRQSTTGPVPPPGVAPKERMALPPGARSVVIPGVPAYLWRHGCGPTAIGMVIGYYDTHGFDALIPGDASTQTEEVDQAIASGRSPGDPGHYEDYSLPLDDGGTGLLDDKSELPQGDEHASDCIADFMRTSWSAAANYYGWSWSSDVEPALESYAAYANPDFDSDSQPYTMSDGTLSWARLTTEVDADRPMVFLVDSDGDGGTDHFVTVVGYAETPSQQYGCLDTWDPAGTIRWCDFLPMAYGRPWGVYKGWTFDPDTTILVDVAGSGDFLTIQDGIDAAVDGGRVLVLPGTYTGAENRDLDLHGKHISVTSQSGPAATIIDCQGLGRGFNFHTSENALCVVDGFTIRNGSGAGGGGIRCFVACSPTLRNLVIEDCASTANGGGIACASSAAPPVSNVAIIGCSATGSGGGIACTSASPTITNVTICGCSAGAYGGGIFCGGSTAARPTIENSIIAGSTSGAGLGCADGANPTTTHSCVYGNAGGDALCGTYSDNLSRDPLFCDEGGGDFTLRDDSPCLPDGNPWGVAMGAYGEGTCPTDVPSESWGEVAVLRPAYPNPSRSGTALAFDLVRSGDVQIQVHDAAGRVVRTLIRGSLLDAGPHTVAWDGRDDEGRDVASGIYFCSVRADGEKLTGKMVVIR
jgi:hypothetical protein